MVDLQINPKHGCVAGKEYLLDCEERGVPIFHGETDSIIRVGFTAESGGRIYAYPGEFEFISDEEEDARYDV